LVEQVVLFEEQQEEKGADPFVAVAEGMILDDKIKKVGRLFFHTGIEFLAVEGLVEVAEDTLKMMLPLLTEQPGGLAPRQEIVLERLDGFSGPAIIKGLL